MFSPSGKLVFSFSYRVSRLIYPFLIRWTLLVVSRFETVHQVLHPEGCLVCLLPKVLRFRLRVYISIVCQKDCLSSTELLLLFSPKSAGCTCLDLLLGFLFCSTDQRVHHSTNTPRPASCSSGISLEIREHGSSHFILLFQKFVSYPGPLHSHIIFRITTSIKTLTRVLTGTALPPTWGELTFLTHGRGSALHSL